MEQIINNLLQADGPWQKFLVVWAVLSPYVYAYTTSTAMLLWRVATRKPDSEGNISQFEMGYLVKDRRLFLIATGIFIFLATTAILKYWGKADAVLLGIFVGVISSYLGKIFEFAGTTAFNRSKKEIKKIDSDA